MQIYQMIQKLLLSLQKDWENKDNFPQNLAFFLSVRPSDFALIVNQLSEVGLLNESAFWRRVLIEKPFGTCPSKVQSNFKLLLKNI